MIERAEIEETLEKTARGFVLYASKKRMAPGWPVLFALGVDVVHLDDRRHVYMLGEEASAELVALAESNPAAYDGAGYVSGMLIAADLPLNPALQRFTAEVLTGERARPKRKGRPSGRETLLKVQQYSLARFLAEAEDVDIPLGRNDEQANGGDAPWCVFEAIADAFTSAGRRTTYADMKSLFYAPNYADLRRLGDFLFRSGLQTYSRDKVLEIHLPR
ncbi:hypothetical protein [Rubellimicrobium mesophilum]|uniref:hypothetical protein n=1 Tax=Rubellimicrobium mesophilum TaxID=1123067 RepID=UPI0012E2E47D|nr:hypothetical protein [Rubellimicrobium mesophilum]